MTVGRAPDEDRLKEPTECGTAAGHGRVGDTDGTDTAPDAPGARDTAGHGGPAADPLVELARRAIEAYVRGEGAVKEVPPEVAGQERAGAFVSLHLRTDDSLRGCIGTFMPTRVSLGEEIITNAISAATRDPRFRPVTAAELPLLDITVDVLEPPEEISGMHELDPKIYGVIVQAEDGRQALLLPDLEGIDTAEVQVRITCRKGGIDPDCDQFRLYRFRVTRHH
jgi:MEMO1 family protein